MRKIQNESMLLFFVCIFATSIYIYHYEKKNKGDFVCRSLSDATHGTTGRYPHRQIRRCQLCVGMVTTTIRAACDHNLVGERPRFGRRATTIWSVKDHNAVCTIPTFGTPRTKRWYDFGTTYRIDSPKLHGSSRLHAKKDFFAVIICHICNTR